MLRSSRTRDVLVTATAVAALLTAVTGVPATAAPAGSPIGIMGAGNNDFTGDGRADMMALYDYGHGEAGLFAIPGTPNIDIDATTDYRVWWVPRGNFWPMADMKITSGDFNGDGFSDVLAIYRYSEGLGLFVYPGTADRGDGASGDYRISFIEGNFSLNALKVTAGDFNGDGLADVLLMYDHGGGEASLRVFPGTTSRQQDSIDPYEVFRSARFPGSFEVSRARIAAGDFTGDGMADLLALYDYGAGEFALLVFPGTTSRVPNSVNWHWAWDATSHPQFNRAEIDTGDFDGNGRTDLVVVTDGDVYYLPGTSGAGSNATRPIRYWSNALGGWSIDLQQTIVGDYDGDGAADVISLLDFGNGAAVVGVLAGNKPIFERDWIGVWSVGRGNFWPTVMQVA